MRHLDVGRFEVKYIVPSRLRDRLIDAAGALIRPDEHGVALAGGGRGYAVHSTYFDTADLSDYSGRLAEFRVRRRVRTRTYGGPDDDRPVFLELKRKLDDQVIKHRTALCGSRAWRAGGERPWERSPDDPVAVRFAAAVEQDGLRPVTAVHYEREVWLDVDPHRPKIRLTLDRDLTASVRPAVHDLFAKPDVELMPAEWMVVELKFDGDPPAWMRHVVAELGLRAEPVSKFGLSVALGLRTDHPREAARLLSPRIRGAA